VRALSRAPSRFSLSLLTGKSAILEQSELL
jgi:hypothetical protein